MIDLERTRASIVTYIGSAAGDDLFSAEREIGSHMAAICDAVIAGDLRLDDILVVQMISWAENRNLLQRSG